MSKKDLVKNVIDELINEGKDFHEITQGTLSQIKSLEKVSRTTIKRAKNEYKKEKIVVKSNYKETLIKRKIYKYLDRNPKTTLSELRDALPEIPPAKVNEYHLFWTRKREKAVANKAKKKVIISPRKLKEMVFNYLNENEDSTCDQLLKAFPDANKSSVTSYYGHWKKKKANHDKGKAGSLYQVIFSYLDTHPKSSIDDLKYSYSDVPIRSLEVYFNLWQKKQKELETSKVKTTTPRSEKKPRVDKKAKSVTNLNKQEENKRNPSEKSPASLPLGKVKGEKISDISSTFTIELSENNEVVRNLLETIEEQKLTLTALEVEYSMLKSNSQSKLMEGFESMTAEELSDVRDFIKTYVKGLKNRART